MRGERIQIPLKAGHNWPATKTPFKLCFAGGVDDSLYIECLLGSFVIFLGIWTSIAKNSYSFVIFQGGSGPPVPPLDFSCVTAMFQDCK